MCEVNKDVDIYVYEFCIDVYFMFCTYKFSVEDVKYFIDERTLDVNLLLTIYDEHFRVLNVAALKTDADDRRAMVKYFIDEKGANINLALNLPINNLNVDMRIKAAIKNLSLGILEYLLENISVPFKHLGMNQPIWTVINNYTHRTKSTFIDMTILRQIVRILLDNGADFNEPDENNTQPFLVKFTQTQQDINYCIDLFIKLAKIANKDYKSQALFVIDYAHVLNFQFILNILVKNGFSMTHDGKYLLFNIVSRIDEFDGKMHIFNLIVRCLLSNGVKMKNLNNISLKKLKGYERVRP